MATFVVLGSFTDQGVRNAKDTTKRADAFREMARKAGVTVKDVYWTLGRFDVVAVIEAPDDETATALTLGLGGARQRPHPDAPGIHPGRDGQDHRQAGLRHSSSADTF